LKALSLLRFFVALDKEMDVPPRTVANSDKKIG
jgi:hypothetical protein